MVVLPLVIVFIKYPCIFQGIALHFILLLGQGEPHILAGMVVTQDTYTHTLIGGNIPELLYVDVVQVIHPYRFLVCPIVGAVTHQNGDVTVFQLLYGFITENPALSFQNLILVSSLAWYLFRVCSGRVESRNSMNDFQVYPSGRRISLLPAARVLP